MEITDAGTLRGPILQCGYFAAIGEIKIEL